MFTWVRKLLESRARKSMREEVRKSIGEEMRTRGTGRTTARILQAIADALLQPDQWVCVCDHEPLDGDDNPWLAESIAEAAEALNLTIDVSSCPSYVFVRSPTATLRGEKFRPK